MNDEDLPPFQWIFDIECFHYLSKVYIKEFCGYCIQTGESILYHVRTPTNIMITMDPMHVTVFAVQSHRHGFSISDGDMTLDEFYDKLNQKVAKDCTIYTTSRLAEQFFKTVQTLLSRSSVFGEHATTQLQSCDDTTPRQGLLEKAFRGPLRTEKGV